MIWFVLGMTFTPEKILLPSRKNLPTRIAAGADWCRLDFRNETVPGSPLDFQPMLDAPAGKYGFVRPAPDGTLRFEKAPAKRLKLYGTNLCQSANFPSKEEAEKIADQIARNGYNSVRFHHHDNSLVDPAAADSTTLNAEMVDRLDFFIAALKKRGIYITTDLFTSRKLKPGDRLPETNPPQHQGLVPERLRRAGELEDLRPQLAHSPQPLHRAHAGRGTGARLRQSGQRG
ncbi:MAG: hypothetical protein L6W00_21940 [Lentisphaeria bacterium]|nr:MAG: hypothetical protein L6W00_21940 [Lentisphaeria bacterium]